jgi:hypothetical protein
MLTNFQQKTIRVIQFANFSPFKAIRRNKFLPTFFTQLITEYFLLCCTQVETLTHWNDTATRKELIEKLLQLW